MGKSAFRRATLGQAIMIGMLCGILITRREVQGFSTVSLWKPQITRQLPLPNRHVVLYNSYLDGLPLNTESSSSTASTATATVTTEEESSTEQDSNTSPVISMSEETARSSMIRAQKKRALLQLLGGTTTTQEEEELSPDPVLADPLTREPLLVRISSRGPGLLLGNGGSVPISLTLQTNKNDNNVVYSGRTDTYLNLLEPADTAAAADDEDQNDTTRNKSPWNWNAVRVFVPPPLRSVVSSVLWSNNNNKDESDKDAYIPMRDLFTSPAVSFAYERGWRQGFAAAGFPGADTEYELVRDFFAPLTDKSVVVDMSCATGLFTRRLAKGGDFGRVLGCDYSESMLMEARRRIQAESSLRSTNTNSKLQLVRCDVGQIPMQTASVPAVHAGAAMHCWPDLPAALSEIYRVLQPGGRYFASTFLSSYFQTLQLASSNGGGDGDAVNIQSQAFQYFESTDMIQSLLVQAGFEPEKIQIEILGNACIIIRCEK